MGAGRRSGRATWAPDQALADLERLALRAPARTAFFDEAAARLKRAVPFDGACWHTLDPGSGLITQHRLQDLPDRFTVLADNEYASRDVNKFIDLAGSAHKAATLAQATGDHPEHSSRFRDLLSPAGLGPELRSAFVADGTTWGALILVRRAGQPEFEQAEVDLLGRASALFARGVRRGLISEACVPPASAPEMPNAPEVPDAPGVIELDAADDLVRASSSAQALLAALSGSSSEAGLRSPALQAIARATRAAAAATAATPRGEPQFPSSLVKTPASGWLVLHGALLGERGSRDVAVFLQRAHPTLVAPLLLKAYGLTAREQEVTQLLLRGATTVQAAQRLAISPHTVTDHVKAIFEKTGARTRNELAASLFFGEHLPRIQREVSVGDDASFIDAPRPRGAGDPRGGPAS